MREDDEKRSGAMRIFEALSSVDEELLERSEEQKKVIPFWRYAKVMAACICLIVVGTAAYTSIKFSSEQNASADSAAPAAVEEAKAEAAADELVAEWEDEKTVAIEETAPEEAAVAADATEYKEEHAMEEAPAEPEMSQQSAVSGSAEDTTRIENMYEESDAEKNYVSDWSDYVEGRPLMLDEETLRATEELGDYIPTELPAGYVFESGYGIDEDEPTRSISLLWVNGMDTIRISISEYKDDTALENRMVDVSDPASYDVHLYEIPYADSVPEKYFMTFHYPIFAERDFTFEIVEARMKSVSDQGDTDTPRGNFAVLYDSGILVEFGGRGDAESIWEMFESIGRKSRKP